MPRPASRLSFPLGVLLVTTVSSGSARAQGLEYIKAHYTKYEYKIPMRDGVKLFTSVYVPKDRSKLYPIMLTRTPYTVAPYGVDHYKSDLGPSPLFGKSGYIFAYQDVRGRYMSEGVFDNMRPILGPNAGPKEIDESTDTYDTIDFLVKTLDQDNGRVGQWGISYPGFYTACGMIKAHPALVAASPQAPVTDWFTGDDWHHNGALFLNHAFNFMAAFGHPRPEPTKKQNSRFEYETPDSYRFFLDQKTLAAVTANHMSDVSFWKEMMDHGTFDDFWKSRNLRPKLVDIRPAVMTVGGWFDAENLFGAIECYKHVEKNSPRTKNTLVMGPWYHGGWSRGDGASLGDVDFNSKTAEFYQSQIEFPFFEDHLKGEGTAKRPEAWVFETGRNQWREHAKWPPAQAKPKSIYLAAGGKLSLSAPSGTSEAFDEYRSDPNKPVPFVGFTTNQMAREYMLADQRFASTRPDVLTYELPIEDADLTIAGPIDVKLSVSTSGTDSDWIVKVIDVYPNDATDHSGKPDIKMGGYQQLIRGDVMRGRFRESLEKPKPFEPNKPTQVSFTMPDCYHTFRPGHKLMIQIQSTWFPLVDRNPQKFVDIYKAKPEDFVTADQRVYRGKDQASRIEVLVLP